MSSPETPASLFKFSMPGKPTYEELEARIRELERADGTRMDVNDPDIIRTLSESFQQLADHSQDAIYLFDVESGTFPFLTSGFWPFSAAENKAVKF